MKPSDWFNTTFNNDEIAVIDGIWTKQPYFIVGQLSVELPSMKVTEGGGSIRYAEPLSKTIHSATSIKEIAQSLTRLLFPDHRDLAERCISFLIQQDLPTLFAHFYLTEVAELYYSAHEIERTIDYCNMALAFAVPAAEVFERESRLKSLPSHKAYERLCIIYDKKYNYDEAIAFAEQAKSQGWAGDWDRRIARYSARKAGVTLQVTSTLKFPLTTILVDGRQAESLSHLDESKKPYIAVARAYGRTHPICRFCHREYPSLSDGACESCFEKSFRYRETPRRLTRCVLCKDLSSIFENHYHHICEKCYNDRKGAFCAKRAGDATINDGGYPFAGCRGCGQDRLVNGFGYCEECYCGTCAVHPVRLCTQCGQYGLNNHIKRESIFAKDHSIEEVWKKDMEMAMSHLGGGDWPKRFRVVADICDPCWKADRRARKQKSDLNSAMHNLKKKP